MKGPEPHRDAGRPGTSDGKLWTQMSRFTPSEVEVWLRQVATGPTRYYRLGPVGPAGDDVSGLQDRQAFAP